VNLLSIKRFLRLYLEILDCSGIEARIRWENGVNTERAGISEIQQSTFKSNWREIMKSKLIAVAAIAIVAVVLAGRTEAEDING
jgi:hypothetical protein